MSSIKRTKYGNKKKIVDGVKFDSKLELYCHKMLTLFKIDFEFQKPITLIERFKYDGKWIRETTVVVDFIVKDGNDTIYVDTKGFPTEVSKIKYKMLKHQLKDESNKRVVWLHSEKEVNEFLLTIKDKQDVNNQQSSIAW